MLKTYIAAKTFVADLKDRFFKDESGASLVEYSILIGIISVAAITGITGVGTYVSSQWTTLNGAI